MLRATQLEVMQGWMIYNFDFNICEEQWMEVEVTFVVWNAKQNHVFWFFFCRLL